MGHGLFFGGPCTTIAENNEPLRLVGQLGGAGIGRNDHVVGHSDPVAKHFSGLQAGQSDMINPVRFDARHGDTPRARRIGGLPARPGPWLVFDGPVGVDVGRVPNEHQFPGLARGPVASRV